MSTAGVAALVALAALAYLLQPRQRKREACPVVESIEEKIASHLESKGIPRAEAEELASEFLSGDRDLARKAAEEMLKRGVDLNEIVKLLA